MTTIRESAQAYEPKETKKISDLEKVNTELKLEERTGVNDKNEEYIYNVTVIDGIEYIVPASVLKQLKVFLSEKPDMTEFKVSKSGEGLKTVYTVIPL